ncbi:MAG: BON domain-containing protein [Armatimonadota bacterium]|nr:BON domain-containing protein [Armatimonadota bacterium]MDR5688209.1 BON domain-containing protein [Armatimonadota bacterium]MDR7390833.1 BON domain-containing protein [Armatimonadota bacterium]
MPEGRVADHRRHRRVVRQLSTDGRVDPRSVEVEVRDGIAILTGTVHSAVAKHAAQEAAHRVPGVLDVVNHVQLPGSGTAPESDVELCRAVRRALQRAVREHRQVRTSVERGWVTLCGCVTSVDDRERAEQAVEQVPGVRGVTNGIHVGRTSRCLETSRR